MGQERRGQPEQHLPAGPPLAGRRHLRRHGQRPGLLRKRRRWWIEGGQRPPS
ncbi:Hypothetical protein AA314_10029 [Archangium gephyra]|uniref:Uncharacterized protein n=1 Tax=Archangium gephyra TaxID=48 RepID=A0AAC8QIP7_9BACT|nr:Hypothetical protein AA314_10029 [Archangium gephyra]